MASPFGERLRALRQEARLTQEELAERAGMTAAGISAIERGVRTRTYRRTVSALADALNLDGDERATFAALARGEPGALGQRLSAPKWSPVVVQPAQLPADVADFTGRAGDVKQLTELMRSSGRRPGVVPVCVVTGPGGIGKTSLAVHAAHLAREHFPDGQVFAQLNGAGARPATPCEALGRLLRDLGADPAEIPCDDADRAVLFRSLLAGRRVLIVLDDARDTAQVELLLPGTDGCAVMVTSRHTLADLPGAHRLPLVALTGDQALELLTRIVGAGRLQAEAQAAAAVTELCEGSPLALRIAGSRLAARPHWRIEDLASRLADAAARLDELAVGDLSVRASIAVSYANLRAGPAPVAPARAFRLLGLWCGPCISAPAAAALFGTSVPAAESALETLLDSHLLQPAGSAGRYRFHDLLRVYAAERARDEETPAEAGAAVSRLLAWYLHSAVAADQAMAPGTRPVPLSRPPAGLQPARPDGPDHAVQWLKSELPNLHAAARTAAARAEHETTWKLAAALCTFHMRQSLWADWIATETTGLASARAIGDRYGQAWLLNGLAVAHWQIGRCDEAMAMLEESLQIRRAIDDQAGAVATLANLGFLQYHLGRLPEVIATLNEALALNEDLNQPHTVLPEILIALGKAEQSLGRYDRAETCLRQALDVGRAYGNGEWEGAALQNLATTASKTGRHTAAIALYDQAIDVFHRAGDRYQETTALIDSGHALTRSGHPDQAHRHWRQARTIAEHTGDPRIATIDALLGSPAPATAR